MTVVIGVEVGGVVVVGRHDAQGRDAPLFHQRLKQRVHRPGRGRGRVLRVHRQDDQPFDALRDHAMHHRRHGRLTDLHSERDRRLRAAVFAAPRPGGGCNGAAASRFRDPRCAGTWRRTSRPKRQDEQVEDEPPLPARQVDDARVAEELAKVATKGRRRRGVGGADLDEENANISVQCSVFSVQNAL